MPSLTAESTGLLAALAAALLWTGTTIFFTAAARRLGATIVNASRIALAVLVLLIVHRLTGDAWWPTLSSTQLVWLMLSGLIGLSLGDQALFRAFLDVGPRIASLLMTASPIFGAIIAWIVLGETIGPIAWLGIIITLAGIAWVVLERPKTAIGQNPPHRVRGILLGLGAALCQSVGLLFSKMGIGHGSAAGATIAPLDATFVRMCFALLGVSIIFGIHWRLKRGALLPRSEHGSRRAGFGFMLAGTVVGPFLGVWMSLVAVDLARIGIAQAIMALTPIFILPFAVLLYRERLSSRAIFGALLAIAGAALLLIRTSAE